jgi:hypothetical protein
VRERGGVEREDGGRCKVTMIGTDDKGKSYPVSKVTP